MAVTALHRLLLHNVYSANFGVSDFVYLPTLKAEKVPFLNRCVNISLLVHFSPYAAANFYQRALLANALTSALRLHQRLPRFQLSRVFLAQALQEDSCHYLLYSLILVNSYPITSILFTLSEV